MEHTKNRFFWILPVLFGALTLACWLHRPQEESLTERRKLAQLPDLTWRSVQSGSFASGFESYTQDQFPLRETFRQAKALFSLRVLGRLDNNGIYESKDGFLAQLEYPMDETSVDYAASRFQAVYDRYLSGSNRVYVSVIPDKSQFLNVPKLSYGDFIARLQADIPFAAYLDISDTLTLDSFYRTDTHWRQEAIFPAAQRLAAGMGKTLTADYTVQTAKTDFCGVYAGQSALNPKGEPLNYIWTPDWDSVTVWDREHDRAAGIFDWDALEGRDPYAFFLSGSVSLITLTNPEATTQDRLLLFRDSFGSSIAPYFLEQYREVTLVDIRYLSPERLEKLLDFTDCDVLFLYSTLVLNNSGTIK